MRLDGRRESTNVEDRRGKGGVKAGGLGLGGIVIAVIIYFLTGQAPDTSTLQQLGQGAGTEYTDGKDLSSLSYKSKADDTFATVTAYCKSGVLCMQIVRTLEPDESPQPTEDMFEGSSFSTQQPDNVSSQKLDMIAEEILLCMSHAVAPSDRDDALAKIRGALDILLAGSSKTSFVYGIRLAEFKYSKTDKLLTVVLEPAK